MSVFENVAFGLRVSGNTDCLEQRVKDALHAVQLDEFAQWYPHQLSGSQQQRVAFARAIVIESACILFDEPLSALDALLREEMRSELREMTSRLGITSVFVTHDQTEAMSMSDKIAVLSGGVVEQYDSFTQPQKRSLWPALWVPPTGSTSAICSDRKKPQSNHRNTPSGLISMWYPRNSSAAPISFT